MLAPFATARLQLANRLVMLPHGTSLVRDGVPLDGDLAYYERRTRGVGLVITGATVPHQHGVVRQRNRVEAFNRDVISILARRNAIIKLNGAAVVGQLNHVGRETFGADADYPPISASASRAARDPYPPHALDEHEIAQLISGFAESAGNLRDAMYDGVELHAAHGYLLAQFLSPATNTRNDRWGGTPEKRCRLLRETVLAIRARCGDDFAIGVRLSAEEEIAGGLTLPDTVVIGRMLHETAQVDYLSITVGVRGRYVRDTTEPDVPAARFAAQVRSEVGLPVIIGQKIRTPAIAERLLEDGVADLIGMARAFIAEPDLAVMAAAGETASIRPCIGLNQDCRAFNPHLHCAVNPSVGRELEPLFGALNATTKPLSVAIVGGGPAGLEAAWIASKRGHRVTLFEASDTLGGQFLFAASLPRRSGLIAIIDHLVARVTMADVLVKLNTPVKNIASIAPSFDAIIVATGALANPLTPKQRASESTMSWFDVIRLGAPPLKGSGRAIFADDGTGSWMSYGAAELLVDAGWKLIFVTTSHAVGGNLPSESLGGVLGRLGRAGTGYRVLCDIAGATDGNVTLINVTTGEEEVITADLVVRQTGRSANDELRQGHPPGDSSYVSYIGDCVTPRRISHALYEAQRLARQI